MIRSSGIVDQILRQCAIGKPVSFNARVASLRGLPCAESGGMLALHAPSERVRRLFEVAGLSAAFTIVE